MFFRHQWRRGESAARGACKTTSLVARCKREKEKGEEFQAVQVLLLVERQQRGRRKRGGVVDTVHNL